MNRKFLETVLVVNGRSLRFPHFVEKLSKFWRQSTLMSTLLIPMFQYIVTKLTHNMWVFHKSTKFSFSF